MANDAKMNNVEIDVDAIKKRLDEIGMSRRKLARKIGYASERSIFRAFATGTMSRWAKMKMDEVLYGGGTMTEDTYREHLTDLQLEVEELRAKLKASQTGDTISRQAAIDLANELYQGMDIIQTTYNGVRKAIVAFINRVPSAQPEIIKCKDCKFWLPHSQFGYDEDYGEYHDYCERLVPEDEYYAFYRDADEFCSRAERRTT